MLTLPTDLVQRKLPENAEQALAKFNAIIEELVNFGSTIILAHSKSKSAEDGIAPIMLFRHYLDILDSLSILVKHGAGDTSKILLRSAWECKLAIKYIFDQKTEERSLAFLLMDFVSQINKVKKTIPHTTEGKEFYSKLSGEGYFKDVVISKEQLEESHRFITKKEKMLKSPPYRKIYEEYLNLSKKRKHPKWYSFFKGPETLKQLAEYLKEESMYELLYHDWSEIVHASNVFQGKVSSSKVEGMADFVQLRFFKETQEIVKSTVSMSLPLFNLFLLNRVPEKMNQFHTWHREMKPTFAEVMSVNFFQED